MAEVKTSDIKAFAPERDPRAVARQHELERHLHGRGLLIKASSRRCRVIAQLLVEHLTEDELEALLIGPAAVAVPSADDDDTEASQLVSGMLAYLETVGQA